VEDRLRKALRLIVGIAVSVACLYFATRGTDWGEVAEVLAKTSLVWVGAVVVASLASLYIRAQRWRVLLRPLGDIPLYPALSATAIGFGASSVLPFRLGEVLRPALLGRRAGVGLSGALSSVVLERLFDMLSVIGCLIAVLLIHHVPRELRRSGYILTGLVVVGFVVLILMQRNRRGAERIVDAVLRGLPARVAHRVRHMFDAFMNVVDGLADIPTVLLVLFYSAYLWIVIALTFVFSFLALDTHVPLVAASLTMVVTVAAAVSLPQAPGAAGTWQFACVFPLERFFHVPHKHAVGYSILTWLVQMVVNIGVAAYFLAREHLSFRDLARLAPSETPPAGAEG
jgi:uncharacterized protein (TIRG00374 family)